MANSNVPMFVQTVQSWLTQFLNADATNKKTIATAGAQGSVIESLGITSTDSASNTFEFYINDGSTDHAIGVVNLPAGSGITVGQAAVDVLRNSQLPFLETDSNGNSVLKLKAGYILKGAAVTTITSGKTVEVIGHGGDF